MISTDLELKDLANFLLLNTSFSADNSLQSGKLAVALFFLHAQKNNLIIAHPEAGSSYLNEILSEPNAYDWITYATGILGGGVVVAHLAQAGLTEHDPDEILKPVEPYLLDRLFSDDFQIIDVATGLSGAGLYLLHRLNDPAIKGNSSQKVYKKYLQACVERIVRFFPSYRPNEYLHQIDTSIWNGLTGVLLFLNKVNELHLSDGNSENVEKEIAIRLLHHVNENHFSWSNAEAFFGLLNCATVAKNKILQDQIFASFILFINSGYQYLPRIDFHNAAFIAVLIRLLGRKYNYEQAIMLSEVICREVKMKLAANNIPDLFEYKPSIQTFQMGIYRGICGTALSLLSLQTGDYNWLKILGIEING